MVSGFVLTFSLSGFDLFLAFTFLLLNFRGFSRFYFFFLLLSVGALLGFSKLSGETAGFHF